MLCWTGTFSDLFILTRVSYAVCDLHQWSHRCHPFPNRFLCRWCNHWLLNLWNIPSSLTKWILQLLLNRTSSQWLIIAWNDSLMLTSPKQNCEPFLPVISMAGGKLQESNILRLLGPTFSVELKWNDDIESVATYTARKVVSCQKMFLIRI